MSISFIKISHFLYSFLFYINDKDQVVVFFNKYELGAGAMGTPEFIIDVSK